MVIHRYGDICVFFSGWNRHLGSYTAARPQWKTNSQGSIYVSDCCHLYGKSISGGMKILILGVTYWSRTGIVVGGVLKSCFEKIWSAILVDLRELSNSMVEMFFGFMSSVLVGAWRNQKSSSPILDSTSNVVTRSQPAIIKKSFHNCALLSFPTWRRWDSSLRFSWPKYPSVLVKRLVEMMEDMHHTMTCTFSSTYSSKGKDISYCRSNGLM